MAFMGALWSESRPERKPPMLHRSGGRSHEGKPGFAP
jgi:hypothetical protein